MYKIGCILKDGIKMGTGFLVASDVVMTVKHNVLTAEELIGEEDIHEVEVEFILPEGDTVKGRTVNLVEAHDKGIDCVYILLDEVLSEREIQVLVNPANEIQDFKCNIVGFPKVCKDNEYTASGIITAKNDKCITICIDREDRLQNYEGLSGAPVIISGSIVGIVTDQFGSEKIEAIPISYVEQCLKHISVHIENENVMDITGSINLANIYTKVQNVISSVGPRYTGELCVKTETYETMDILLKVDMLEQKLKRVSERVRESVKLLNESGKNKDPERKVSLSIENTDKTEVIMETLKDYAIVLDKISENSNSVDQNEIIDLAEKIGLIRDDLRMIFEVEEQRFNAIYGEGKFDDKSWRGFMASYGCVFPTAYLDYFYKAIVALEEAIRILNLEAFQYANDQAILISGKGGVGKTHLLCDIVNGYLKRDVPAILMLGESFDSNKTIYEVIENTFCIDRSLETLLSIMNYYGKKNRVYIPICIDAINEMSDNTYWNRNLSLFIEQIKKYEFIKLIISCRSLYIDEYLDEERLDTIRKIEHNGFEGREEDALTSFCAFYNVKISYDTINTPEFVNPLFLKMLCEIAQDNEDRIAVLADIETLMKKFFEIKNKTISQKYSESISVRDNIIGKVLNKLILWMSENSRYTIAWDDLRRLVMEILDSYNMKNKTAGVINQLISENLLREADENRDIISFAYQKFYEYQLAQRYIQSDVQTIVAAVEQENITLGTLEMIQIGYFKKHQIEFIDAVEDCIHGELVQTFMSGLYWRDTNDFNDNTKAVINRLFWSGNEADIRQVILGMLGIATKLRCPINARYIHEKLKEIDKFYRDYILSYFLLKQYDQQKVLSDLCERAIHLNQNNISKEQVYLWKLILSWGCGSNDVKLRDKASKGLMRLLLWYPDDVCDLLNDFKDVDDDYIHERIWQAINASIVVSSNEMYANHVMDYILTHVIQQELWPQNVLIRNQLRNIFEYSFSKGWCDSAILESVRPPYNSIKVLKTDSNYISAYRKKHRKLYWNCTDSDFAIYTIPSEVGDYGFAKKEVGLIIFKDLISSGYTAFEKYDMDIDRQYGSLRNRDEQVERIGKKYQKIFLYRTLGSIYDNYPYKPRYDYGEVQLVPSESGIGFREIDLTIPPEKTTFSIETKAYPFYRYKKWDNMTWFKKNDIEKGIMDLMTGVNSDGTYVILQRHWSSKEEGRRDYREVWTQIRTYIFDKSYKESLLSWLQGKDFEGRWMPEGSGSLYEFSLGEYPWSPTFVNYMNMEQGEVQNFRQEKPAPCLLIPTVNEYLKEKESPFFMDESGSFMLPSAYLMNAMHLTWDGKYSFLSKNTPVIFNGPDDELYIEKTCLLDFLKESKMDIIWTVLGEKQVITAGFGDEFPGRAEFSYSYYLDDHGRLSKNHEIFNVLQPKDVY